VKAKLEFLVNPTVARIAARYRLDPSWVQSIVEAEGGTAAIIKAVQCSLPKVTTLEAALEVVCISTCHRMSDFIAADPERAKEFVKYFGSFWAPLGVTNDPHHLNENWVPNVTKLWGKA
jgi:hypothetical protein